MFHSKVYVPVRIHRRSDEDIATGTVRTVPPALGLNSKATVGVGVLRVPVTDVLVHNPGSKSFDEGILLLRDPQEVTIGDFGLKSLLNTKGLNGSPKAEEFLSATVGGTQLYFHKGDLVDAQGDLVYPPTQPWSVWVPCFKAKGSSGEKVTVRVTGTPPHFYPHEKPVTLLVTVDKNFVIPNPNPNAVEGECLVLLTRVWKSGGSGGTKDQDAYETQHPKFCVQLVHHVTTLLVWGSDILSKTGEVHPMVEETRWVKDVENCVWPPLGTRLAW